MNNMYEVDSPLLNQDEAAKYLHISRNTLRSLGLPQTRIRHRLFFRKDILDQYIKEYTLTGRQKWL